MNNTCPRLIEVALPVREISAESVRDKSLRHGHISTLHLWWARRPLAACRAVVFASLVFDPDDPRCPEHFKEAVEKYSKTNVPEVLKYEDWKLINALLSERLTLKTESKQMKQKVSFLDYVRYNS